MLDANVIVVEAASFFGCRGDEARTAFADFLFGNIRRRGHKRFLSCFETIQFEYTASCSEGETV